MKTIQQEKSLVVLRPSEDHFKKYQQKLERAERLYLSIRSIDDLVRTFLKGEGKSQSAYMNYRSAIRLFFSYIGMKHPRDILVADVEDFFDFLSTQRFCMGKKTEGDEEISVHCRKCKMVKVGYGNNRVHEMKICKYGKPLSKKTIHFKIASLRTLFKRIAELDPIFQDPFTQMNEKLRKKLNGTGSGKKDRSGDFLIEKEVVDLLRWLRERMTKERDIMQRLQRARDYAVFFMLVTSGLRSSELLSLRWGDIVEIDGRWYCEFKQKGGDVARQELFYPAVKACEKFYRMRYHREPSPQTPLFSNIFSNHRSPTNQLKYPNLRQILIRISEEAYQEGVLKRKVIIRPHTLRRSYALLFHRRQMSLRDVSLLLRHRSVETTSKHYLPDEADPLPILNEIFSELD